MFIVFIFILSRLFGAVVASFAHSYDKYNEVFQFKFQLYHSNPFIPKFLISFANYDGAQYLRIAHSGYQQFQQAFFPLFPLLIHVIAPAFGGGYFLSGIFISNACFLLGLYILKKYLELIGINKKTTVWIILFLIAFPTSFFFMSVYTESLFFCLFISTLYALQKKQYILTFILGAFTSLTRLTGVFLVVPLLVTLFGNHIPTVTSQVKRVPIQNLWRFILGKWVYICVICSPIVGLLLYMSYLNITVRDPLAFYHMEYIFGAQRSTHIILLPQVYFRYIKIFLTSQHTFIFAISICEFIVFNVFLLVLCYDFMQLMKNRTEKYRLSLLGINLFSLCNLLLPTLAGSLSSMPRYALLSLSFFFRIATIKNVYLKLSILLLFMLGQGILLWLFIQGYFIS